MPRNGSDIYSIPPGTEGFPDTTIESEKYNIFIHDVETDLNTPRPIVAGGTGSSTADGALAEMGGEKASQVVTNYDSHLWMPGSFYSATSATASPVAGHAFTGWVTSSDPPADPPTNMNVVVQARDQNDTIVPGRLYVREKKAGVWGIWKLDGVSLYVADTPPLDAPDKSLWWESDSGLLYLRYNDGAGTPQWVIACPQPDISVFALKTDIAAAYAPINSPTFTGDPKAPTPTAGDNDTSIATTEFVSNAVTTAVGGIPGAPSAVVRYDIAQTLTAPQLIQARQNIYAAPFDAMAYSGMQINGGCEISQELGVGGRTTAGYFADGWIVGKTGTMAISAQAPVSVSIPGFNAFVGVYITTAQVSLGASDFVSIVQYIEGYRVARLAWGTASAAPITIAFWSRHTRPGLYSVAVRNAADTRSYCVGYTHAASDVAQYNVVTVPGCTDGTWETANVAATKVTFCQAAGSNFMAPVGNVWNNINYFAVPGQVNAAGATSDVMRITGITVLPGNEAPSAARSPFIMRPYDQELVTCQRYYQDFRGGVVGFINGATIVQVAGSFNTPMRAAPTVVPGIIATIDWSGASSVNPSSVSITAALTSTLGFEFRINNYSGLTSGQAAIVQPYAGSPYAKFDARL